MKRSLIALALLLMAGVCTLAVAQKKRTSPPKTAEGTIDGVKVKIAYCSPSADGRKMLGGIEPYGSVWRTGANNATTFEIDKPIMLEGKALPAGKYELFTIPGESEWTIIIQSYQGQWGAFKYSEANDVLRVKVNAGKPSSFVEAFAIAVDKDKVTLQWENTLVAFKVAKA